MSSILHLPSTNLANNDTADLPHEHREFFKDLPKFTGTEKDDNTGNDDWWSQVILFFKQFNMSEEKKLMVLNAGVSGLARKILDTAAGIDTLRKVDDLLRPIFEPKIKKVKKLVKSKQEPDETVTIYAVTIRMNVMSSGISDPVAIEDFALQFFLNGLRSDLMKKVQPLHPETFERDSISYSNRRG